MTSLKKVIVNVLPYDDYATVREIYGRRQKIHHLGIKTSKKRNYPFVILKQDLPPYTTIVIRLDKLGLDEVRQCATYDYYFEE
mgnify:CR=1 FL=1|jgi:hypothetical protein|nr:MAG TPA_asm: hypothetical protein [Caudoviricetes sp.]